MQTFRSQPGSQQHDLEAPSRIQCRCDTEALQRREPRPGEIAHADRARQSQKHVSFISGLIAAFSVWAA